MTRKPTDPLPDHYGTDDWEDMDAGSMTPISDERLAEIVADKDNFYRDEIKSMARELQSRRAQGEVRVKSLEWAKFEGLDPSIYRERAVTSFGTEYHISKEGWWEPLCALNECESIEAAKAAAQADYERRILSATEASPAPVSEECATDGCSDPATVRFERGGVGSKYCHSCYLKVQALAAKGGQ